jgi:hypothetical protein
MTARGRDSTGILELRISKKRSRDFLCGDDVETPHELEAPAVVSLCERREE